MKKKKFMWIVSILVLFSAVVFASLSLRAEDTAKTYYYLSGTDWNQGTNDAWVLEPHNGEGLSRDYANKAFMTNSEVISQYKDGMKIYVRPGMALRFNAGPNWHQSAEWNVSNANSLSFVHDGWEWAVANSEDHTQIYNVMLIEQQSQYKTITATITDSDNKQITMYIYVVPYNTVDKLEDVLAQEHVNGTTDVLDSLYIKALPVTLYNYNGLEFNRQNPDNFQFKSVTQGVDPSEGSEIPYKNGINEGSAQVKQGIFQSKLDENGLPVFAFKPLQTSLFSDTSDSTKEVYKDVAFQFVFDSETNYYTYSSMLNHAQYNSQTNTVELYRQSMGTVEYNEFKGKQNWGGFYPFTDISKAFLHSKASEFASNQNLITWAEALKENFDESKNIEYYAQTVKDLVRTEQEATQENPKVSTVDMHFGLKLQTDFYLPQGKKNGTQNLRFEFTGDDDMWVFIDGELVLDMGGGHIAQSGYIDFTTGECYVKYASQLKDISSITDPAPSMVINTSIQNLSEDQMHTMTVFYLERFSGESNCYMRFNLPIIPDNEVHIAKKLTDQNGGELSVKPDVSYKFKLFTKGQNESEFKSLNGYTYTVNQEQIRTTQEDGTFYLRDTETAVFQNIDRFTQVYAVEYLEDGTYVYTQVQAGKNTKSSEEGLYENETQQETIQLGNGVKYDFHNFMLAQKLTFMKTVVGGSEGLIDANQEFVFKLCIKNPIVGNISAVKIAADGVESPILLEMAREEETGFFVGTFALKQGEQLCIPSVPVQMFYSIEELEPQQYQGSFDAPSYKRTVAGICKNEQTIPFQEAYESMSKGGEDYFEEIPLQVEDGGENKIEVTNLQRGTLILQKQGWEEADTKQTFLFHVKGAEGTHTQGTDLTVMVIEGAETAIEDVVVGKYTITEEEGWSWRYEAKQKTYSVEQSQCWFGENASAWVLVENERTHKKWFDANNWCKNIFKLPEAAAAQ